MKRQFSLGVVALLIASSALATESRIEGMGGIGTYKADDTNQFIWPQLATGYEGNAFVELKSVGSPDAVQTGGATFAAPRWEDYTVGLYLNRSGAGYLMHDYSPAMDFGGMTTLILARGNMGLSLSWGGDTSEYDDGDDTDDGDLVDENGTISQVAFGLTDNFFGNHTTDLAARLTMASGEQIYDGTIDDGSPADVDESNFAFEFAARNHYDGGGLVSALSFGIASGEIDPEDAAAADFDSKSEVSAMGFGFGLGWEMPVTGNTTATLVCEPFSYRTYEMDTPTGEDDGTVTTTTTMMFPSFFLALEGDIRSWLQGRMGVAQTWGSVKTEEEVTTDGEATTEEWTNASTDFEISFGMTVKVNDTWSIDGVFNEAHLFGGPNILTGAAPGPWFGRVSVTGSWN